MAKYFDNFPDTVYNGTTLKNITMRAKILDSYKSNASNFYPYTLSDGETADNLAYDYYGDPGYNWIIYYCNDIIDPYYDWPVSNKDFDAYIKDKYGSVSACQSNNLLLESNSYLMQEDNGLTKLEGYSLAFYRKKPSMYYISRDNPILFLTEAVYSPTVHGYSWDKVSIDDDIRIYSTTSPNPAEWMSIDCYTYELEENEKKRYIKLLDKSLIPSIERQLREIMNA